MAKLEYHNDPVCPNFSYLNIWWWCGWWWRRWRRTVPIMIRQKDVVLSFSHNIMKKTQLFMQIIMKSIVATRTADMNRLCVIPDNVTSLTVNPISRCATSPNRAPVLRPYSRICQTEIKLILKRDCKYIQEIVNMWNRNMSTTFSVSDSWEYLRFCCNDSALMYLRSSRLSSTLYD